MLGLKLNHVSKRGHRWRTVAYIAEKIVGMINLVLDRIYLASIAYVQCFQTNLHHCGNEMG